MATGTVKWFNESKGFGFLSSEEENEDVFVHFHAIKQDGSTKLTEGQVVTFEVEQGPRGLRAKNISSTKAKAKRETTRKTKNKKASTENELENQYIAAKQHLSSMTSELKNELKTDVEHMKRTNDSFYNLLSTFKTGRRS